MKVWVYEVPISFKSQAYGRLQATKSDSRQEMRSIPLRNLSCLAIAIRAPNGCLITDA